LHHKPSPQPWPVVRFGRFPRQTPPFVVQRYRYRACGRTFSDQTFSPSYWLKRPELLAEVLKHAVSGAANRQVARLLGAAPATVDHQLARLGRHCLLFQRHFASRASPAGDIALDGLVTFEHSQYLPYEIVAAVDRPSSFVLHFCEAERRRSGTMTAGQRRRRAQLEERHGKADRHALRRALQEVLGEALQGSVRAKVVSDKHPAYPGVVAQVKGCVVEHVRIDSRAPRTALNPLFEVNLLDLLLRHCLKDHTRETIAFGKRRAHSMYRAAVFVVWRNFLKWRRERRCRQTPAMVRQVVDRRLTEQEVLARRLFVSHYELPPLWEKYYWRRVETRVLAVNRRHELKYAA